MRLLRHSAALAALSLVVACGDDSMMNESETGSTSSTGSTSAGESETGGEDGRAYYDGAESAALGADGNKATCATCHSDDGSQDGLPGNTLMDIAFHTSFKGGDAADLLAGANACITGWMGGTALAADDAEWVALKGFIESISSPDMTTPNALEPEVLDDEAAYEAAYAGGDAVAGADAYAKACAVCHDSGLQVGSTAAYPKMTLAAYTVGRIAQKVRTSGPPPSGANDMADSTPGPMPFFEAKDLSATDLADIIAHIKG
ncbi:MAG: c-type cytochrome [Myxococcales bacterium]|nr:c-type cytochrome [Myxococcales bacterium]